MKRLIVFDLDGTLAKSKAPVDAEMARHLAELLRLVRVAIISGGGWPQFKKQVLSKLPHDQRLENLSILPTCGTKFYRYERGWKKLYSNDLSRDQRRKVLEALDEVVTELKIKPKRSWGDLIEDRGSQITYSGLGQEAPLQAKEKWDPKRVKRAKMQAELVKRLPEFSVRIGGSTSVDITQPGIDKAYGIEKLREVLGINVLEMVFVGDALYRGGNDYPAKRAGCDSISVRDPEETCRIIQAFIACFGGDLMK